MRTLIVTGATGGLGSCLVKKYINCEKTKLICTYRDDKKFDDIFGQDKTSLQKVNVQKDNIERVVDYINHTDMIILVLNAFSIQPLELIGNLEDGSIESAINVNILQQVKLLNTVIRYSHEKQVKLRIINIDSGAADFPLKGWGLYCAGKAFVNSFLGVVQLENAEFEVVSIDPGVMNTVMQQQIRATSPKVFDKVDEFIAYKNNNILREPMQVADYITNNYIEKWNFTNFRDKVV